MNASDHTRRLTNDARNFGQDIRKFVGKFPKGIVVGALIALLLVVGVGTKFALGGGSSSSSGASSSSTQAAPTPTTSQELLTTANAINSDLNNGASIPNHLFAVLAGDSQTLSATTHYNDARLESLDQIMWTSYYNAAKAFSVGDMVTATNAFNQGFQAMNTPLPAGTDTTRVPPGGTYPCGSDTGFCTVPSGNAPGAATGAATQAPAPVGVALHVLPGYHAVGTLGAIAPNAPHGNDLTGSAK